MYILLFYLVYISVYIVYLEYKVFIFFLRNCDNFNDYDRKKVFCMFNSICII